MRRLSVAASARGSAGSAWTASRRDGCRPPAWCIPSPTRAFAFGPEAGAQCGSSARWDLCGGPPARAVPTAIRVLREHGCGIAPNTYWTAKKRSPSKRAERDAELVALIQRVYEENLSVYGADKIWAQLNEDGERVAR